MGVSNRAVQVTIRPLRLIFWGGLFCVIDIWFGQTVNGHGFRLDLANDLVGMLMIMWVVTQLRKVASHERYQMAMLFVAILAALGCLDALHGHFIYQTPVAVSFLISVLGALGLVATVVFCASMRWLCREAGLPRSERSWRVTMVLFALIHMAPMGLFYCASAYAMATKTSFNINLGPEFLLALLVFCIPMVHLFVSTSRMKTEVESTASILRHGAEIDGEFDRSM